NERLDIDAVSNEVEPEFLKGMTALCYAMNADQIDIAMGLFQAGANITYLPISMRWELLLNLIILDEDNKKEYFTSIVNQLSSGVLSVDEQDENFIQFLDNIIADNQADLLEDLIKHNPKIVDFMIPSNQDESEDDGLSCTLLQKAVIYGSVQSTVL